MPGSHLAVGTSLKSRPVTTGGRKGGKKPLNLFSPPLEKCVGNSLKISAPLRKLFGPSSVSSWLRACLGVKVCCRFNAVSTNISHKTYKSTILLFILQNHLENVQTNKMCLSNGIVQITTHISKIFMLFALCENLCENILHQERFLSSRVACCLQNAFTSVDTTC